MPIQLDRSALDFIAAARAAGAPRMETLPPGEARQAYHDKRGRTPRDTPDMHEVRDLAMPGPAGEIPLRLYRPLPPDGPAPVIVFFHGGGWVVGDLDTHDALCRVLSARSGMAIVAVDYRLAPEHPFPAAAEDSVAATAWVHANAAGLGLDPDRLSVAGDSAGGNLSAVVAQQMRDGGSVPIRAQALIYPAVELGILHASHRDPDTDLTLSHALMRWFRDHYLARPDDAADVMASPLRAADLSALPPAYMMTASADPLHDEGIDYATRLKLAGVPVTERNWDGQFHGFMTHPHLIPQAVTALHDIGDWLKATVPT